MSLQDTQSRVEARNIFQDALVIAPTFSRLASSKKHIYSLMQAKADSEHSFVIVNQDELTEEGIRKAIAYTRDYGLDRYIDILLTKYDNNALDEQFLKDIGIPNPGVLASMLPQNREELLKTVLQHKLNDMDEFAKTLAAGAQNKNKELYGAHKIRRGLVNALDRFSGGGQALYGKIYDNSANPSKTLKFWMAPAAVGIIFCKPFIAAFSFGVLHAGYGTPASSHYRNNTSETPGRNNRSLIAKAQKSLAAFWEHTKRENFMECAPHLSEKQKTSLTAKIQRSFAGLPERISTALSGKQPLVVVSHHMAYCSERTENSETVVFDSYKQGCFFVHPGLAPLAAGEGARHYANSLSTYDDKQWQEAFAQDMKSVKAKLFLLKHSFQPAWWLLRPKDLIDEEIREELGRIYDRLTDTKTSKKALSSDEALSLIQGKLPKLGALFREHIKREFTNATGIAAPFIPLEHKALSPKIQAILAAKETAPNNYGLSIHR